MHPTLIAAFPSLVLAGGHSEPLCRPFLSEIQPVPRVLEFVGTEGDGVSVAGGSFPATPNTGGLVAPSPLLYLAALFSRRNLYGWPVTALQFRPVQENREPIDGDTDLGSVEAEFSGRAVLVDVIGLRWQVIDFLGSQIVV